MKKSKEGMNRRKFLKTGVDAAACAALAGTALAGGAYPAWAAGTPEPVISSGDDLFGFVEDMWRFGNADRYGYRMPGTVKSDKQNAEYIYKKIRKNSD